LPQYLKDFRQRAHILHFFAIFLYQYSLPPCYNPFENHSMPQRRFPVEKTGTVPSEPFEEPHRWPLPMIAPKP
jgi:hypothetical protein